MHKSVETRDNHLGVHTVNGVDTFTASVFNTPLKDYTKRLENGFNLELATDILTMISTNPLLWTQGSWRSVTPIGGEHLKAVTEATRSLAAWASDLASPRCATSMCCAGWAVELAKADWVVDGTLLAKVSEAKSMHVLMGNVRVDLSPYVELVVVPRTGAADEPKLGESGTALQIIAEDGDIQAPHPKWLMATPLVEHLMARGFTPETHYVTQVATYGAQLLGIGNDPLRLFGGSNDLDDIERIIDYYAEHGADLSVEAVEEFFGPDSSICTCASCIGNHEASFAGRG